MLPRFHKKPTQAIAHSHNSDSSFGAILFEGFANGRFLNSDKFLITSFTQTSCDFRFQILARLESLPKDSHSRNSQFDRIRLNRDVTPFSTRLLWAGRRPTPQENSLFVEQASCLFFIMVPLCEFNLP